MDKPETKIVQTRFLVDKRHGTYYCYEPNGRSHIEKSTEKSPKGDRK